MPNVLDYPSYMSLGDFGHSIYYSESFEMPFYIFWYPLEPKYSLEPKCTADIDDLKSKVPKEGVCVCVFGEGGGV